MPAQFHMEALSDRVAAGQRVVPLRLPVEAVEWSCHAPTTIRDANGEVLAECGGHGRAGDEDEQIAAEITRRLNTHEELQQTVAFLIRWHDQLTPADIARAKAVLVRSQGDVAKLEGGAA